MLRPQNIAQNIGTTSRGSLTKLGISIHKMALYLAGIDRCAGRSRGREKRDAILYDCDVSLPALATAVATLPS